MAHVSANIFIQADDPVRPQEGGESRWIKIGRDAAIFASDAKMIELRDAIDAYLARGFAAPAAVAAE
jgi:hypothetical protein